MRIQQLSKSKNYLYEGLDYNGRSVMSLWESAGIKLKEAQLTPDQINKLFAEIEKSSTEAGGNRTALGMGKDALSAVNKAWEDLKTKVQDSKPIKNVDSTYDGIIAKIEAGLGGPDNAVSKVIMGYRKFAKEHPIAQGLIYSVLIAAAGISGAGLGGAAVLGLLKMTDKLLQGEKFSSAAYSGAKTGAMAYGASKIGDYVKGKMADKDAFDAMGDAQAQRQALGQPDADASGAVQKGLADDQAFQDRLLNKFPPDKGYTVAAGEGGKSLQVLDASGQKVWQGDIPLKTMDTQTFADLTNNGQMATPGISSGSVSSDPMAGVTDTVAKRGSSGWDSMKANANPDGSPLTVDQINAAKASLRAGNATDMSTATDAGSSVAANAATQPFGAGMSPDYLQQVVDAAGKSGVRFKINPEDAQKALDWQAQNGGQAAQAAGNAAASAAKGYSKDYLEKVLSGDHPRPMISKEKAAALLKSMESVSYSSKPLSEGQVYLVFNRVCALNDNIISEGPMDWAKGVAGKAMDKIKTVGTNLTTKITADKLNSAWQKSNAPTDSEELKKFLTGQGVNASIVDSVYKSLKIKSGVAATSMYAQVKLDLAKLDKKGKQRLAAYLQKQLGTS